MCVWVGGCERGGGAGYVWGRGVCGGWGVYGQGVCAWRWGREGCACLRIWCAGRDRGDGESHSQAKDNAVCVCVCVWGGGGWRRGRGAVCGVRCAVCAGGLRTSWVGVCVSGVRMCVCAVCRRGVRAGMRVVCRVFLWVVRAETEAESRSQAKDDAVGVWYGHGVCGGGGGGGPACGACGVCGGRAETDRVRQRITCMDGYPASSACVF